MNRATSTLQDDAANAAAGRRVLGALALELAPGSSAQRDALAQSQAGALATCIARDLATLAPAAAALQLVLVGAHYDAVELLRPQWPLHQALAQLAARAPGARASGDGGRIVAFGAHEGRLPDSLAPAAEFSGGPLRLLPWLLEGDAAVAAQVSNDFEHDLIERGMAGAETALLAQEAFGLQVEHARYLTVHDLAALMALQYEHAGLAPLWPIVEAALLAPDAEEWLDAPPEPAVHYVQREARIALPSPQAWRARYAPDVAEDCDTLERRFALFQARQRQFAAVLQAHAIAVTFVHCDADADTRSELA